MSEGLHHSDGDNGEINKLDDTNGDNQFYSHCLTFRFPYITSIPSNKGKSNFISYYFTMTYEHYKRLILAICAFLFQFRLDHYDDDSIV